MPVATAGTTTISLAAGDAIFFSRGTASVYVSAGVVDQAQIDLSGGPGRLGPFGVATTLKLTVLSGTVGYTVPDALTDVLGVRRAAHPPSTGHKAVMGALQAGSSAHLFCIGDSTSVNLSATPAGTEGDPQRWFLGAVKAIAAAVPGVHVMYKGWDGGNQRYNAWQTIQTGTLGQRYALFTGSTGVANRTRLQLQTQVGDFATDIDFRIDASFDDWTPSSIQCLFARYSGAGFRGFHVRLQTNGDLPFLFHADPASETSQTLNTTRAQLGSPADGDRLWLRWTLVVATGVITSYRSTDGITWTTMATATLGATTFGAPTGINYEIGGRGANTEVMAGKIYEVQLRSGIDGSPQDTQGIESWDTSNAAALGGSPTLYCVNGSLAGQGLSYFNDAARYPKLVHPAGPAAMYILNTSHNETSANGTTWTGQLDAWLTAITTRAPLGCYAITAQNPEKAPAASPTLPNMRSRLAATWAARKGQTLIDIGAAIGSIDADLSDINPSDGVHPLQADYNIAAAAAADAFIRALA